jgi:hypothetical protein
VIKQHPFKFRVAAQRYRNAPMSSNGFQWCDRAPNAATFDRLMRAAAQVIDAWIASRL